MAKWTGSWLSGTAAVPTGVDIGYAGSRFGLPERGPDSVATWGIRVGAFALDAVAANLVVGVVYLFGVRPTPGQRSLLVLAAFFLIEALLVPAVGQTVGMRLLGMRVAAVRTGGNVPLGWAAVRAALLCLLVPAVIYDRDRRGLHDRAADAVVIRTG